MKIDICKEIYDNIDWVKKYKTISFDSGVSIHISKYHPECLIYIPDIETIITKPDYIGVNPNEKGQTFELIKVFDNNILVGIKLDTKKEKLYVASMYKITDAKIEHGIKSCRLKKLE